MTAALDALWVPFTAIRQFMAALPRLANLGVPR